MTEWRNRITAHGQEAPDQLLANPRNWRVHPKAQQDVIGNQRTGHVVDGHARIAFSISKQEPAIDATQRKAMAAGQTLTAKYKGSQHTVDVVAGEGGKLLYRLVGGREFKSPSSAGSAGVDGTARDGWHFRSPAAGASPRRPKDLAATSSLGCFTRDSSRVWDVSRHLRNGHPSR